MGYISPWPYFLLYISLNGMLFITYLIIKIKKITLLNNKKGPYIRPCHRWSIGWIGKKNRFNYFNFLKEIIAEFHTYQAHNGNFFRIVIRNIHLLTPTTEIGIEIDEIRLFLVRNVSNIINKNTKI